MDLEIVHYVNLEIPAVDTPAWVAEGCISRVLLLTISEILVVMEILLNKNVNYFKHWMVVIPATSFVNVKNYHVNYILLLLIMEIQMLCNCVK